MTIHIPRGDFAPPLGRPVKYPIGFLNVGESLFFPGVTHRHINSVRRVHRPRKFRVRTVIESGLKGVRVWRVDEVTPYREGRPPVYPFRTMAIGESILIRGRNARQIGKIWWRYRPLRFTAKTIIVSGVLSVRVWRIA